jgi:hypothetical protein
MMVANDRRELTTGEERALVVVVEDVERLSRGRRRRSHVPAGCGARRPRRRSPRHEGSRAPDGCWQAAPSAPAGSRASPVCSLERRKIAPIDLRRSISRALVALCKQVDVREQRGDAVVNRRYERERAGSRVEAHWTLAVWTKLQVLGEAVSGLIDVENGLIATLDRKTAPRAQLMWQGERGSPRAGRTPAPP